jgi:hypothetical protein
MSKEFQLMHPSEDVTRLDILNSFESNMRILLRSQLLSRSEFMRDMLLVSKYVGAIKDGVFLAEEVKTSFQVFLPLVDSEWKDSSFTPLVQVTEQYAKRLADQLEKQQILFEQVSVIIAALDTSETTEDVRACIKSTLVPITVEFKIMKLLCQIHQLLFQKDQELLHKLIDDFLSEFQQLDAFATQPLLQLRGLIEQFRIAAQMPTEASFIKHLLERVIEIAQTFVMSFCCSI